MLYCAELRSGIRATMVGCSCPVCNINRPEGHRYRDSRNFPVQLAVTDDSISYAFLRFGNRSTTGDIIGRPHE